MTNSRLITFLIFLAIYVLLEVYVYSGLVQTFKNRPIQRGLMGLYYFSLLVFVVGLITLFTSFSNGYSQANWWQNLVLGLVVTFFITKLIYAAFLLIADLEGLVSYIFSRFSDAPSPRPHRRKVLKQLGVFVAAVPFSAFLYGVLKGRYDYKIHRLTLRFPDLPPAFDGFRIAQISDVHSGSFDNTEAVKKGIDKIAQQKPDVVLFTGDLVNNLAEEIVPYIELFAGLQAPHGKFAVLGNHDYGEYVAWESEEAKAQNLVKLTGYHKKMGFHLLNNAQVTLHKGGDQIKLVGVENWGKKPFPQKGDLNKAFAQSQPHDFSVLMSHDPSHWDEQVLDFPQRVHLTLSGHTHGMQMGVEIPGFRWSPIKYRYPRWAGLYKKAKQYLYVNRGFGFIGFPGRVGIWPEITIIELKSSY